MQGKASVKVPGGKLVRVEAEYDDVFETVKITGDFFLEPPEALDELEDAVEGLSVDDPEEDIAAAVDAVDARMIGFEPEDLAEAVRKVVGDG